MSSIKRSMKLFCLMEKSCLTLPALHWAAVSVFLYYTCFDIFVCFLFTVVFKQITHSSIQISTNCKRNRTESVKYAFQLTKRILD